MKVLRSTSATLVAALLAGCASAQVHGDPPVAMDVDQCKASDICSVSGRFEILNDGHAYIGKLDLPGGACVNVSVPVGRYRDYLYKGPKAGNEIALSGRVLPYVYHDGFTEIRVNGRGIGYGRCGDFYIFVK